MSGADVPKRERKRRRMNNSPGQFDGLYAMLRGAFWQAECPDRLGATGVCTHGWIVTHVDQCMTLVALVVIEFQALLDMLMR